MLVNSNVFSLALVQFQWTFFIINWALIEIEMDFSHFEVLVCDVLDEDQSRYEYEFIYLCEEC